MLMTWGGNIFKHGSSSYGSTKSKSEKTCSFSFIKSYAPLNFITLKMNIFGDA